MSSSVHSARYKFFVKRLKEARRAAGLSQVEVAKRLGQTQNIISKCELGDRRVDAVELWDFAKLYGQPLVYFLDMESGAHREESHEPRGRPGRRRRPR